MRSSRLLLFIVVLVLASASHALRAHHAEVAEYDSTKPVKVSGTLTKVEWSNPHVWFYVDVKGDDGKVTTWGFATNPPGALMRRGVTKNALKIGEVVNVEGVRAQRRLEQRRHAQPHVRGWKTSLGRGGCEMTKHWIGSRRVCRGVRVRGRAHSRSAGWTASPRWEAGFHRHVYTAIHRQGDWPARQSHLQRRQDGPGEAWRRRACSIIQRTGDTRVDEPRAMCLPAGFPSGMLYILPIQIVHHPKYLVIIPELQRAARIIPTDGRKHREGIEPSYYGDPVGRWEGDTLVIESVNFKPWILDDYHYTDRDEEPLAHRCAEDHRAPAACRRQAAIPDHDRRLEDLRAAVLAGLRADPPARLGPARPSRVRLRREQSLCRRQLQGLGSQVDWEDT